MEVIVVEYFPTSIDPFNNDEKYEFHDDEEYAYDSHAHMFYLFK